MRIFILWILLTLVSCASLRNSPVLNQQINPYSSPLKAQYQIIYQDNIPYLWINAPKQAIQIGFSCYKDIRKNHLIFEYERDFRTSQYKSIRIKLEQMPPRFWFFITLTNLETGSKLEDAIPVFQNEDNPHTIAILDTNNQAILQQWVTTDTRFKLQHNNPQTTHLYIKYYGDLTNPAQLPTDTLHSRVSIEDYQSVARVPIDKEIQFSEIGSYWIQSDSNSKTGLFILCSSSAFPYSIAQTTSIDCMRYLCTEQEFQSIATATKPQNKLQAYWANRKQKIRRKNEASKPLISVYYNRIQEANALFSGWQKGCLVDKGMAYIVFGPPDKVVKWAQKELWFYHSNAYRNPLELIFYRQNNRFRLDRSAYLSLPFKKSLYNWKIGFIE